VGTLLTQNKEKDRQMASVNKVIIVGNLTRDPETRTAGSTTVTELGIATNRRFKKNDEWVEEPEYHSVIVWSKQGENCQEYLSKGRQVYVEGRMQTRSWEDKTHGDKRYKTEVVANVVQFLGGKGEGSGGNSGGGYSADAKPGDGPDDSDEIPF